MTIGQFLLPFLGALSTRPAPVAPAERIDFVRHPRARHYVIRVRPDGSVRVTVPRSGSKRQAQAFVEERRAWIARARARVQATRDATRDGVLDPATERALRARARVELPARLLELAAQQELQVSRITIRNQRARWGSCSRSGHICLNWRLVHAPAFVRDYVLIHELMHLRRLDHSRAFWRLVHRACPDHLEARAWLREHGSALLAMSSRADR